MKGDEPDLLERLKARPRAEFESFKKPEDITTKSLAEVSVGDVIVLGFQEAPNKLTIINEDEIGDISRGMVTKRFFLSYLARKTLEERNIIAKNNGFSPE